MNHALKIFFILVFAFAALSQTPSPSPTPDIREVFGNTFKKIYFVGDCYERWAIPKTLYVNFSSEEEAKNQGFTKSEYCRIVKDTPKTDYIRIEFFGDSETKLFYPLQCAENMNIKDKNRIAFQSKVDAETKGYKLSDKCSQDTTQGTSADSLPTSSGKSSKQSNSNKSSATKLKKAAKAYNLLQVLTYPEIWTDRKIIIKGEIRLDSLPDPEEFNNRTFQAFILRDNSQSITLIASESPGTKKLRDIIISNDGNWVEGTFTFILFSKTYRGIGRIGRLESYSVQIN
jgi:hypothetical protein